MPFAFETTIIFIYSFYDDICIFKSEKKCVMKSRQFHDDYKYSCSVLQYLE